MGGRRGRREIECFCKAGKIVTTQAAGISEVDGLASLWLSFPCCNLGEIFPSDSDCISVMRCWGTTGALQRDSILSDSCFKDGMRNAKIWLGFAPRGKAGCVFQRGMYHSGVVLRNCKWWDSASVLCLCLTQQQEYWLPVHVGSWNGSVLSPCHVLYYNVRFGTRPAFNELYLFLKCFLSKCWVLSQKWTTLTAAVSEFLHVHNEDPLRNFFIKQPSYQKCLFLPKKGQKAQRTTGVFGETLLHFNKPRSDTTRVKIMLYRCEHEAFIICTVKLSRHSSTCNAAAPWAGLAVCRALRALRLPTVAKCGRGGSVVSAFRVCQAEFWGRKYLAVRGQIRLVTRCVSNFRWLSRTDQGFPA